MRISSSLLPLFAACALLSLAPAGAAAESSDWNVHIDLGPSVLAYPRNTALNVVGGVGAVSVDYQLAQPFALELLVEGGAYGNLGGPAIGAIGYFGSGFGGRYRFLDNTQGYADEPGGDTIGNAWVSAHIGYHFFQLYASHNASRLGLDLGVGYEWSLLRPIQVGLFARGTALLGGGSDPEVLVTAGVNVSFELGKTVSELDTDQDGLGDERETNQWNTDPNNPDTDADRLLDGLEVRTRTDPVRPDTDGDSLQDGAEDANANGSVDAGESDPRLTDTDSGGVGDAWEMAHPPHDPRNPADDDSDRDRVLDDVDACPNTPPGSEIDARGCIVIPAQIVLDGIQFAFDSAEILPESEQTLMRGLQTLLDNPTVHVEIGGHTDNVGTASHNNELSQARAGAVRDWLVAHGIAPNKLRVRGYGATQPRAANDTEEGRAQNRRIEFRVTSRR